MLPFLDEGYDAPEEKSGVEDSPPSHNSWEYQPSGSHDLGGKDPFMLQSSRLETALASDVEAGRGGTDSHTDKGKFVGILAAIGERPPLLDVADIANTATAGGTSRGMGDQDTTCPPPPLALDSEGGFRTMGERKGKFVGMNTSTPRDLEAPSDKEDRPAEEVHDTEFGFKGIAEDRCGRVCACAGRRCQALPSANCG
jgi:hypothetical protein